MIKGLTEKEYNRKYYQRHLADSASRYVKKKTEKDATRFRELYGRLPSVKELEQFIENKKTTFTPKLKGSGSRWFKKI